MIKIDIVVTGVEKTYKVVSGAARLLPRIVEMVAKDAAEETRPITHVVTGALQKSHVARRIGDLVWEVTPDPAVINIYGQKPADYGPVEHARGGSHAFYERFIMERLNNPVMARVNDMIEKELR